MDKIITCEISFIPILSEDYRKDVDQVLEIISSYELECNVGLLSTTIRGRKEIIFEMIRKVFGAMENKTKFTMDIKLSNECGCS